MEGVSPEKSLSMFVPCAWLGCGWRGELASPIGGRFGCISRALRHGRVIAPNRLQRAVCFGISIVPVGRIPCQPLALSDRLRVDLEHTVCAPIRACWPLRQPHSAAQRAKQLQLRVEHHALMLRCMSRGPVPRHAQACAKPWWLAPHVSTLAFSRHASGQRATRPVLSPRSSAAHVQLIATGTTQHADHDVTIGRRSGTTYGPGTNFSRADCACQQHCHRSDYSPDRPLAPCSRSNSTAVQWASSVTMQSPRPRFARRFASVQGCIVSSKMFPRMPRVRELNAWRPAAARGHRIVNSCELQRGVLDLAYQQHQSLPHRTLGARAPADLLITDLNLASPNLASVTALHPICSFAAARS